MATAAVHDRLLDRMLALSPEEFEILCKIVLTDSIQTTTISVTPASQDGGIDIEGRLSYDWFAADFGVQVKRFAEQNRVSNDRVHRLAGALVENDYDIGTFITTSSYTGPAIETANQLPIKLVSGEDLTQSMLRTEIGVTTVNDRYELDTAFWQDIGKSDERIPASEVPLGNNFDRIRAVLCAIRQTDGEWKSIQRWVARNAEFNLSKRHVYINANSASVLGFARKEPARDNRQRWGLTPIGAEYINADPTSTQAQRVLQRAIRSVGLVERIHSKIAEDGELSHEEIDEVIKTETTGLSNSSVRRRSSAIRTWLEVLPDVELDGQRTGKVYAYVGDEGEQSSANAFEN